MYQASQIYLIFKLKKWYTQAINNSLYQYQYQYQYQYLRGSFMTTPILSLDRFVKIWFSRVEQLPLGGALNEYRLQSHRLRFPNDKLTLISNFEDFSKENQEYIIQFCQKHDIRLVGLREIQIEIEQSTLYEDKKTQCDLLAIARLEIMHDFGNLAAASDIVRTLSPVVKYGIYTDFDMIKLKPLYTKISSPIGLWLDAKFYEDKNGLSIENLSNASFACEESATSFLKIYRQLILERYHKINETIIALNEEKIFNIEEYNQAKESIILASKVDKSLPAALRFRAALKRSCNPKNYDKALKQLVMMISGPKCMQKTFETIMSEEFFPLCKQKNFYGKKQTEAFQAICLISKCLFLNEDDGSWLPSMDKRQETWSKVTKAATTIQSMYRMRKAKNALKELKEKSEASLGLHLPN